MTTQQAYNAALKHLEQRVQGFVKKLLADSTLNQNLENGDNIIFDSEVSIEKISSTSSEVYIRLRLAGLNLAALEQLAALVRDEQAEKG